MNRNSIYFGPNVPTYIGTTLRPMYIVVGYINPDKTLNPYRAFMVPLIVTLKGTLKGSLKGSLRLVNSASLGMYNVGAAIIRIGFL